MNHSENIAGIILAAGKGKRMHVSHVNKVTLSLGGKPLIMHGVELMEQLHIHPIVVVVGFAKQSVINILGRRVVFAEQKKRLGTAHALSQGMNKIPQVIKHVMVLYGDDFAYPKEKVKELIKLHVKSHAAFSFLTITQQNPFGLGRVVRDMKGRILRVVEEKDATSMEKKIQEVNPGCFLFTIAFLKKYLQEVKKSEVTSEYYLTSLIEIALVHGEKVQTLQARDIVWKGVNTRQDLQEAERLFLHANM